MHQLHCAIDAGKRGLLILFSENNQGIWYNLDLKLMSQKQIGPLTIVLYKLNLELVPRV